MLRRSAGFAEAGLIGRGACRRRTTCHAAIPTPTFWRWRVMRQAGRCHYHVLHEPSAAHLGAAERELRACLHLLRRRCGDRQETARGRQCSLFELSIAVAPFDAPRADRFYLALIVRSLAICLTAAVARRQIPWSSPQAAACSLHAAVQGHAPNAPMRRSGREGPKVSVTRSRHVPSEPTSPCAACDPSPTIIRPARATTADCPAPEAPCSCDLLVSRWRLIVLARHAMATAPPAQTQPVPTGRRKRAPRPVSSPPPASTTPAKCSEQANPVVADIDITP
jgi:hypothetical protein